MSHVVIKPHDGALGHTDRKIKHVYELSGKNSADKLVIKENFALFDATRPHRLNNQVIDGSRLGGRNKHPKRFHKQAADRNAT